jgi:hypothetical protein
MPRKIRQQKTAISIFGYITAEELGSNKITYGADANLLTELELYSIAIKYFEISGKVKVNLKINDDDTKPSQIYFNFRIKNEPSDHQAMFNGFIKEFIKLYQLQQINTSVFYKRDADIISKYTKTNPPTTIPITEQKLRFIEDD